MPRDEHWAAPTLAALNRVRSRSAPPSPLESEVRRFLSEADEQEVLGVLCERFRRDQRVTSDDVRFVVRAVASHSGAVDIPPDLPPSLWILEFKRSHGFLQLGGNFTLGLPDHVDMGHHSRSGSIARVTASSVSSGGSSDEERGRGSHYVAPDEPSAQFSKRPAYDNGSPLHHTRRQQQQQQRRSMVVNDHRTTPLWQHRDQAGDREELSSNASSGSENGTTTGASSSSSINASADSTPPSANDRNNYESPQEHAQASSEKRSYKLSHTVLAETWEKAIAAVEQQGMSLRSAAKIYGVHFAALHRRVKKRAQGGQSNKSNNSYFHPSDEAGIMRVVVAHAELGVLMTFDELMKLVETSALRKLPDISVENARKLMVRFQSRNEQSIRHIIEDWPPPVPAVSSGVSIANHYHLEHPGYDYGSRAAPTVSMERTAVAGSLDDTTTAAAAPSQFFLANRLGFAHSSPINATNRPVLPSMNVHKNPLLPHDNTIPQLPQRVPRAQESSLSRPVMYV